MILTEPITNDKNVTKYFPIVISGKRYEKLLVIQTHPIVKYWFKDKEINIDELISVLENDCSDIGGENEN